MLKLVMLKRCIVSRKFVLTDIKRNITKTDCCYKLATSDSDSTKHDGISSSLVKRVVKSAGFPVTEGFTTIQTVCPVCSESDKRSKNLVYINKITGLFSCPTCQHSASWENISKFFDLKSKDSCSNHLIKEREIFIQSKARKCKYVPQYTKKKLNLLRNDIHLLNNTWISAFINPTLKLPVSFNTENGDVHFPLCNSQNIVVGEKICNIFHIETETTLPDEGCYGLLTLKLSSKESSKAVIVLTVKDFLTLAMQKLESTSVICLPYGLKLLPQECLPCLERFKELILWFDFDDAGWDSALNFARKLDEKRCLFIRPTNEQQTPYTAFKSGLNIKAIVQDARPILHKSITTFACLKQDIFSELQNIEKVNGVKWTRYPSLNKILKGHRKGELTILTGPTGCGKTTFMSEYSLDLAIQGVTTLWGSFEIRNIRLASTLLRQFVGYPLNDKLEEFDYWTSKIEKLPIYFTTFHGQQSLKIVMDAIDHAQYIHDIHHIIIDNVQFMLGMGTGSKFNDKFWEQDNIISAFRTFATKKNVHVTLVMHPRKEKESEDLTTNSIFGSAKAAQEADNVLIIQDKRLTSIRGKKVLQVVKNRYSGDLGIMPLDFDKDALSYAQRKKN